LAGKIDGEQAKGAKIPFQDLLIGATGLELGYAVVTGNPRHFQMIPDLIVKLLLSPANRISDCGQGRSCPSLTESLLELLRMTDFVSSAPVPKV
jgi:hypothetical protein